MLLVTWPIVFGLTLTLLRLIVLAVFGSVRPADAVGLSIALAGFIAEGLVLAVPLHLLQRTRARFAMWPVIVAVVFVNVAAFHYEAVFSRLPGVSMLYYLREAASLGSSAAQHAPWWVVILEVVVGSLILLGFPEVGKRRLLPPHSETAICLIAVVVTIVVFVKPSLVPRAYAWRARTPLLWAAQSWSLQRSYATGNTKIDREQVIEFQKAIGHTVPFGGLDERYPLCDTTTANANANGRSVIFLILESIANEEVKQMPALQRIARESVWFGDVKAGGTKSLQAMPALFAGVPPQPGAHLLWREPLNNLEGFPLILRNHGYRTAYFHGGDLSFEQQRPFLRMTGFEEIVELDPTERIPLYGWGYADDVMFAKMQRWIEAHRNAPYLAALFTLSTHDPYAIPNAKAQNLRGAFVESLQFLDQQLARFYDWYLKTEAPRGTILVITGDHAPHLSGDKHIEDDEVMRFDVPLIVHGPPRGVSSRPAAHHDLPATILGLTGLPPGRCDQGLDLFAPSWPRERTRYAVAGDQLEEFHVWFPDARVHLDRARGEARATPVRGGREAAASAAKRAETFYDLARDISSYLVRANAFAPPPSTVRLERKALPRVARPIFVSHRGHSRGELPVEQQNKRATIEQALADGFEWVEIDVNITRDGIPVVIHDDVSSKTRAELADVMTLEEAIALFANRAGLLIELKPQGTLPANSMLAMRAALLVRERTQPGRVVMDSFSPFLASSLDRHCNCPVGLDAPNKPLDSHWVDNAALTGMEWIYVHWRQASPELIRHAHSRGVRVAVYTVNDVAEIQRLAGEWPDAVITDRAELVRTFSARFR